MSTGQPAIKGLEHLRRVAAKALDDDAYRQELLDHPAATLKKAGLKVPDGMRVVVHQNTDQEVHLVLSTGFLEVNQLNAQETDVSRLARTCMHV